MPTWPLRSAPSRALHPRAPDPVDTSQVIDSWRSWKPSDYADLSGAITAQHNPFGDDIGITRTSA
jgi:hypothetical protein